MNPSSIILIGIVVVVLIIFAKTIKIVPQKTAFIVERLGKYRDTLHAGLHVLLPFVDKVSYKLSLKEQALDVPPQTCITQDNIAVEVDGILYLQVIDAKKASYGINNYQFASTQLAQTTMRSVIGKLELDRTFEERETINSQIVDAVDNASDPWGVKVTRYEVKNIVPPQSIKDAMEKQMRAVREKRALIAESEGDKQARINRAEGVKSELIAHSEGEKQRVINVAAGKAGEIEAVAIATAKGIREIATAINEEGGMNAVNLRVAEQYIIEFGNLAKTNNSLIVPSNVSDVASMIASAMTVFKQEKENIPEK
jgi:regulator of protease activity HflC (stomatin/prohibitin superfamily)